MYILILESSTTSAKAMLYNTADGSHEVATKAYPLYFDDATLHDAERVFLETAALGKTLCESKKAERSIEAVALSATWPIVLTIMASEPDSPMSG